MQLQVSRHMHTHIQKGAAPQPRRTQKLKKSCKTPDAPPRAKNDIASTMLSQMRKHVQCVPSQDKLLTKLRLKDWKHVLQHNRKDLLVETLIWQNRKALPTSLAIAVPDLSNLGPLTHIGLIELWRACW